MNQVVVNNGFSAENQIIKMKKGTSGTKEWADHNINCIKGCSNNCRYCYAKMMGIRFGRCTKNSWENMEINQTIVKKQFKKYNGRVMFPSSHDITNKDEVKNACFTVIGKLLDVGNDILVTTKPSFDVINELMQKFQEYQDQIQFRFTITSNNDELLKFWEPNAPSFQERINSLQLAFQKGYKTSVSIEPFLDEKPQLLFDQLKNYVTESIWIGPMNYISRKNISNEEEIFYNKIRSNIELENIIKIYNYLKDEKKIRFKDTMKHMLNLS